MSTTQLLTVIVRDTLPDATLGLGTTNVFAGESNSVALTMTTTLDLADVSFLLQTEMSRFPSLAFSDLGPGVSSASVLPVDGASAQVHFQLIGGGWETVRTLARLNFRTATNGPSARIPLHVLQPLVHEAGGQLIPHVATTGGTVFLIQQQPIVVANRQGQRVLTLYGHPGETFAIERSVSLTSGWSKVLSATLTLPTATVVLPDEPTSVFYRAKLE